MTEPERDRPGIGATLLRWRAPLVLIPLTLALAYSGMVGAQMLWGQDAPAAATEQVVTCWDGTEAFAAGCPETTGVPGLRWTFPSFEPGSSQCRKVTYRGDPATRPLEFSCRTRVDGTAARISYSERSNLERGLAYFDKRYQGVRPTRIGAGTRIVYRDPEPRKDGSYEVTVAYADHPFAVTVNAVNERLRDRVLDDSVSSRPARFVQVRPAKSAEG